VDRLVELSLTVGQALNRNRGARAVAIAGLAVASVLAFPRKAHAYCCYPCTIQSCNNTCACGSGTYQWHCIDVCFGGAPFCYCDNTGPCHNICG
jgi:hypothetical protein